MSTKYLNSIDELDNLVGLSPKERNEMENVSDRFPFRANEYYLSLINWKDRRDPIRKIIIPDAAELQGGGCLDPSCEKDFTRKPGLQHKYDQTSLLLLSDVCGGICRFCFRKRLFIGKEREAVHNVCPGLDYIREHTEITNVLLTGGDPLTLETRKLETILRELREIDHVQGIRIGSKMPAYDPYRILNDPGLCSVLRKYSTPEKRIYLMTHFNHPNELTPVSVEALNRIQQAGVVPLHQTPILNGVNSDSATLTSLFRKLTFSGVAPYYVFQCRPSLGNRIFQVPVEKSYQVIQTAWQTCSGLAKRARFVMSHATGKIEIVGKNAKHVFMRYHQAADRENIGKFMVYASNPEARWLEDYREASLDSHPKMSWLF